MSGRSIAVAAECMSAHSPTTTNPLLTIQLQPEVQEAPLIAHFLPPDLPRVDDLPLQGTDVTSGALAFEISHSRIAEAFERLQDDIKLWSTELADDSAAVSPVDLPLEVLQQQQADAQAAAQEVGHKQSAGGEEGQSAASEQGSAESSGSGDAGKHASPLMPTGIL